MEELYQSLETIILESGATYGTVMNVINKLYANYMTKGENLLNSAKIQEVFDQDNLRRPVK